MLRRLVIIIVYFVGAATPLAAEVLEPEQSVHFVEHKVFEYTCFNRVKGEGRILADGSVIGNFQLPEEGRTISAALPPGTIMLEQGAVCAHLTGLIFRPCFKVDKIDDRTFRGSIVGLDFAYCTFHQVSPRKSSRRGIATPHKTLGLKSLSASALY